MIREYDITVDVHIKSIFNPIKQVFWKIVVWLRKKKDKRFA